MRVLQLISSEGYFGAESMLVGLASGLSAIGVDCYVGVIQDSRSPHIEVAEEAERRGLKVRLLTCRGRLDPELIQALRRTIRELGITVLHTHGYKADIYGYCASVAGRNGTVATCHNWPNPLRRMQAYAVLDRKILRRFDQVVAVAEPVEKILLASGISNVRTIMNGVDSAIYGTGKPVRKRHQSAPVVGFVGRMVPEKGGDLLLRCVPRVLERVPAAKFVFVGDGPSRPDWEALAAGLGIQNSVEFLGIRRDMPDVYASFDVSVLPSVNEGTPMCVLEAMAAAVPVVGTAVGSLPAIIEDGKSGFVVRPGDAEGLTQALLRILSDAELRTSMAGSAKRRLEQKFSAKAMAKEYLSIYEDLRIAS